ncbi:MAG TPA: cytochrome c-type biogenesis protein CcmH [Candidatus Polarisedimenticolia bacterium]|nr:cytochrome c-type biogenesis protein CcmH [Candidatus Polarisedimenticolia bacterium]
MTKVRPIGAIAVLAIIAMAPLLITPVGAQQLSDRARQMGMKIKCMCRGCDMAAGICSHPGGAFSGPCETAKAMLKEVDQHVAKGETDEQILQAFVQEYGTQVFAEPPKSGFSLVAWILPSVYLFVGTGVVILVIARWRKRPAQQASLAGGTPGISPEMLERARAQASRETQD